MKVTFVISILMLACPVQAQSLSSRDALNGTWLVAEADEGFSLRLVITPQGITAFSLDEPEDAGMEVRYLPEKCSGSMHAMKLQEDNIYWLFQDSDQALAWMPDDDNVHYAVRQVEMPPEMMGEWMVWTPEGVVDFGSVTCSADSIIIQSPSGTQHAAVYPVYTQGPLLGLGVRMDPGYTLQWLHVQPMPDGSLMMWPNGDDDYIILYREGQRPSWTLP